MADTLSQKYIKLIYIIYSFVVINIIIRQTIKQMHKEQVLQQQDYEYPALCIPRALGNITQDELHDIIHNSRLGAISKIVIKPKEFILPKWERTSISSSTTSEEPEQQTVCYNNIYIYFKKWNTDDPRVRKYRDNVINGKSIKIVHNSIPTPIFWKCVAANFTSYRNKINNTDI